MLIRTCSREFSRIFKRMVSTTCLASAGLLGGSAMVSAQPSLGSWAGVGVQWLCNTVCPAWTDCPSDHGAPLWATVLHQHQLQYSRACCYKREMEHWVNSVISCEDLIVPNVSTRKKIFSFSRGWASMRKLVELPGSPPDVWFQVFCLPFGFPSRSAQIGFTLALFLQSFLYCGTTRAWFR